MIRANHSITFLAGRYISYLFAQKLPQNLVFHNFHHTTNVVLGVKDIGNQLQLSKDQQQILVLSAWFHDSGHIVKYQGHEEESQKLALDWLTKEGYPPDKITEVLSCIAATKLPQHPNNLLQEIICDADLYHLSLDEYCHLQFQLREELKRVFNQEYSEVGWLEENLSFMDEHQYFTAYGKTVLEKRKLQNRNKCQQLKAEYLSIGR